MRINDITSFPSSLLCAIEILSFSSLFFIYAIFFSAGTKWLEKGQMYYMEVLFGENDANDWFELFMRKPEEEDFIPVSNEYLYPYTG